MTQPNMTFTSSDFGTNGYITSDTSVVLGAQTHYSATTTQVTVAGRVITTGAGTATMRWFGAYPGN